MKHILRRAAAAMLALGTVCTSALALTPRELGELLEEYYVGDIPQRVWEEETVEGMIAALGDPYTAYMDPAAYAAFQGSMADVRSVGLGVRGRWEPAGGFRVEAVFPESPAQRAGVRVGEVLTHLDGKPLAENADLSGLKEGEEHTLTVRNADGAARRVAVTAGAYVYPTAFLVKTEDGVSTIDVNTYGSATYREVYDILTDETVAGETDAWVLDLRENGGGSAYPAVYVPGAFLGSAQSFTQVDKSGPVVTLDADPEWLPVLAEAGAMEVPEGAEETYGGGDTLAAGPLYVLVSDASASAAEISALLSKRMGGILVGERTFGKGVGQSVLDSASHPDLFDGDGLKITSVKVYGANGVTTHVLGVIPNFVVPRDEADEVAALLASPLEDTGDVFQLDVPAGMYAIPISASAARAHRETMALVLEALPPEVTCTYNGAPVTVEELAEKLGIPYESRWFDDVRDSPYADALNTLATYGIVEGREDGAFHPTDDLTRGEMAAVIVRALGPRNWHPTKAPYGDVAEDAWYHDAVAALSQLGWVRGDELGNFHPEDPITHQEFFLLLTRALRAVSWTHAEAVEWVSAPCEAELRELYPDYAGWALDALWQAEEYAWDDVASIDPVAPVTREEAGAAIYNLMTLLELI